MAGPGTRRLCISSSVGLRVIDVSVVQVVLSTAPVWSSFRFSWNPLTPFTVPDPYVPLMLPAYQSSCRSRCWSSRTLVPLSPFCSMAATVGAGLLVGLAVGASVVADGAGTAVVGAADAVGEAGAETWLSGAGAARSEGIWPQPVATKPNVRAPATAPANRRRRPPSR